MRPIHSAAAINSKECMELLLAHGAKVNTTDRVSNTTITI